MRTYLEEIEELLVACGLRGVALEAGIAAVVKFGDARYETGFHDGEADGYISGVSEWVYDE